MDAFLPEFDHEMATTRALLERVPEKKTISMKALIWPWTALSVDRPGLLNDLLKLTFRAELPLLRLRPLPFGTSAYCIAQRMDTR